MMGRFSGGRGAGVRERAQMRVARHQSDLTTSPARSRISGTRIEMSTREVPATARL